jgi:hypothetical protein
LDGQGGSGKTFAIKALISKLRGEGFNVFPVAMTGIAASAMDGGQTAHSRFGLKLSNLPEDCSTIKFNSLKADKLRDCDLIIWDECSMISKNILETVNRLFNFIHSTKDTFFYGIPIVCCGDFRQTLPIIKHMPDVVTASECVIESPLWNEFIYFKFLKQINPND